MKLHRMYVCVCVCVCVCVFVLHEYLSNGDSISHGWGGA